MNSENKTSLSNYRNQSYNPGGNPFSRSVWFSANAVFFRSSFFPFYSLKSFLLRLFGAKVGKGVVIKPCVNIKYPWKLTIGDFVWIGENAWIDNLADVKIGSNSCLSQGAFLLTGNHDYSSSRFDLITKEIVLEDGVWIGAKAVVCPGVHCGSHSVLTVGSVASKDLEAYSVYSGSPALKIRERIIKN